MSDETREKFEKWAKPRHPVRGLDTVILGGELQYCSASAQFEWEAAKHFYALGKADTPVERPAEDWMRDAAGEIARDYEYWRGAVYNFVARTASIIAKHAPLPPKSEEPR